jgi:hypothetical protein
MPRTDEPGPIALRPAARALDAASQEHVALALTLMTKFPFDEAAAERAATASAIAEALEALAAEAELAPDLRRLCTRLKGIWAALEAQHAPAG